MRSIQTLGLTCIAAASCAAAAENAVQPEPHAITARAAARPAVVTMWQPRADQRQYDRLRYLDGSPCAERPGCSTSAAPSQPRDEPDEYDYIDSLDLGNYGPMKFKFTGDRVKVKVRF